MPIMFVAVQASCCCEQLSPSSQTCIISLSGLCGAVGGSFDGVHEFRLTWPSQGRTAALRCIAVVVQVYPHRPRPD